jgi:ATP synthase protein I
MSPLSPQPPRKTTTGGPQAILKAEKLTQIAFALPISVFVGWLLGAGLDKLLHRHWIYIAGLVVGAIAGFAQIFRMIGDTSLLADSAPDPSAPKGPGFDDSESRDQ